MKLNYKRTFFVGLAFMSICCFWQLYDNIIPLMLKNWEAVQSMMGATPESLANLPLQLREMLSVISPTETERLLNQSGIHLERFGKLKTCDMLIKGGVLRREACHQKQWQRGHHIHQI